MTEVRVGKDESLDSALKRFKKKLQEDGVLSDIRRHEYYEKPSEKRNRKKLYCHNLPKRNLNRFKLNISVFRVKGHNLPKRNLNVN